MSVGGLVVDGASSIWVDISGCSGVGDGSGSGVESVVGIGAVVGGGNGATGQPFSHLKPVYAKPGSGPDISRNKQSINILNISIDLVPIPNFKLFRVKKLPPILSHLSVHS